MLTFSLRFFSGANVVDDDDYCNILVVWLMSYVCEEHLLWLNFHQNRDKCDLFYVNNMVFMTR